ncbi:MAG: ATP-binding protein [Verrucomicrobiota bacterium]
MTESLEFFSEASALAEVRLRLRGFLSAVNLGEDEAGRIVLAIDEACTNIIRHAHGGEAKPVRLTMERRSDRLVFVLIDQGGPCDPELIRGRSLREVRPGGLGVHIIREVFDVVDYLPTETGTRLTLEKRI